MTRNATTQSCNILIVGEAGVGKSSLVNYLIDKNVVKVDVGKSVTPRDDVPAYTCISDEINLPLSDSWGIEADKTNDWVDKIRKIIGKDDEDAVAWFRTVVYCISCDEYRFDSKRLKENCIERRSFAKLLLRSYASLVEELGDDGFEELLRGGHDVRCGNKIVHNLRK